MALSHLKNLPWPTHIPDEDWEEVSQGVPSKDEPFISKYLQGREALVDQEKKQRSGKLSLTPFPLEKINLHRSDYAFRQSLSPLAREACDIVSRIRAEEARTTWTAAFEDHLAQETGSNIYPGMMFNLAKDRMEKTKLWQIVRKMPKGALLHAHMDALVDLDYIFGALMETSGMHIYCEQSLGDEKGLELGNVRFKWLKKECGRSFY